MNPADGAIGGEPTGSLGPGGDLHSWKEIAAYLGKSVRAVQRWERELGLPVHRLKTNAGQAVFASRNEIDAWFRQHSVKPIGGGGQPDPPPTSSAVGNELRVLPWVGAALALLMLIVTLPQQQPSSGERRSTMSFGFRDGGFERRDANGTQVWRHEFDRAVIVERPLGVVQTPLPIPRVQLADLDGDGQDEVLVVVSFLRGDADVPESSDELWCFSSTGIVRWVYRPDQELTFRAARFGSPWYISAFRVSVQGERREVFLSVLHNLWWPSAVIRVASDGTAETVLVNSGHLYTLGLWDIEGQQYLVAGGINNEYASAAFAMVSVRDVGAHSPQSPGSSFECLNCPGGVARQYLLFTQGEIGPLSDGPYNRVSGILNVGDGLRVFTLEDLYRTTSESFFSLPPGFRLSQIEASLTDGYWHAHRHHEALGRILHRAEECPFRRRTVRMFERARGWESRDIALTGEAPGESRQVRTTPAPAR